MKSCSANVMTWHRLLSDGEEAIGENPIFDIGRWGGRLGNLAGGASITNHHGDPGGRMNQQTVRAEGPPPENPPGGDFWWGGGGGGQTGAEPAWSESIDLRDSAKSAARPSAKTSFTARCCWSHLKQSRSLLSIESPSSPRFPARCILSP